ncbi:hypothetical protein [Actinomadura sp. WMMB 499]|uniref:hypothetical protein n=1 Tax=Actinomadura sp. WMMB 499 TaxID=1219491 RepID=UPI001245523D|nr:hypothetical protein [Actinomadura sp. WMMB 499]QFG23614.1 hypothetical protein F7P10_23330 [Actinomadura sp. WMMB 499]
MKDRTFSPDPLACLGAHLSARRLDVDLTARGLRVTNPDGAGCCAEANAAADVITCRPRPDDGGREWFWTSWNEPIAEADRIVEATTFVLGYLARGRETDGTER